MHYIHFKAKEVSDVIYETGIILFPFFEKLNINKIPIFNTKIVQIGLALEAINYCTNKYPNAAKSFFPKGIYTLKEIPLEFISSVNKDTILTEIETIEFCTFIYQRNTEIFRAKKQAVDFINTLK